MNEGRQHFQKSVLSTLVIFDNVFSHQEATVTSKFTTKKLTGLTNIFSI